MVLASASCKGLTEFDPQCGGLVKFPLLWLNLDTVLAQVSHFQPQTWRVRRILCKSNHCHVAQGNHLQLSTTKPAYT